MTWTVTDNGSREDDGALPGNRLQPSFNLPIEIEVRDLSVFYGKQQALFEVSVDIPARRVTAFIGPSGSGKSSFLRVLNRTLDLVPGARLAGTVLVNGEDITLLNPNGTAITRLRRRVGMLFQRPNPFPLSIFENVAYGIRSEGRQLQSELPTIVERSLQQVGLWGEVKHRLGQSALQLSLGQQQLLCLARALAVAPEVLLLDEPCAILDPAATRMMEDLIAQTGLGITVILMTSNPRQAQRLAHYSGVFLAGRLIECAPTHRLFTAPQDQRTRAIIADFSR